MTLCRPRTRLWSPRQSSQRRSPGPSVLSAWAPSSTLPGTREKTHVLRWISPMIRRRRLRLSRTRSFERGYFNGSVLMAWSCGGRLLHLVFRDSCRRVWFLTSCLHDLLPCIFHPLALMIGQTFQVTVFLFLCIFVTVNVVITFSQWAEQCYYLFAP